MPAGGSGGRFITANMPVKPVRLEKGRLLGLQEARLKLILLPSGLRGPPYVIFLASASISTYVSNDVVSTDVDEVREMTIH